MHWAIHSRFQCRHACGEVRGGALRDDTKYGSVADYSQGQLFFALKVKMARESGFWGNFACGIGNLGFEIRNTAQGIQNSSNKCNPESKFH